MRLTPVSLRLPACLAVALGLASLGTAQFPPPSENQCEDVGIDQRDWLGSLQATTSQLAPTPLPSMELDLSEQANPPAPVTHAASIKGAGVTVKIRIINNRGLTVSGSMTIQGARLEVPGPSSTDPGPCHLSLSVSPSSFTFTLNPHGGFIEKELTVTGLPNHVAVGAFQIHYDMPLTEDPGGEQESTANNGTEGGYHSWERICILNAAPVGYLVDDGIGEAVSPWEHGIWTDFIEYSCRWSYGATSEVECRHLMTKGMFLSRYSPKHWLYYDPYDNYYWNTPSSGAEWSYLNLEQFLIDLGNPLSSIETVARLDCRDFAGTLCLALSSQGAPSACARFQTDLLRPFTTWPVCPAGADPSMVGPAYYWTPTVSGNYMSSPFNFHVVNHSQLAVFDASNAYFFDGSGMELAEPACGWLSNTYWQRATHPYFGLAYRLTAWDEADISANSYNFFQTPVGAESEHISVFSTLDIKPTFIKILSS